MQAVFITPAPHTASRHHASGIDRDGVRSGACAAPRMSGAKPGEDRRKTAGESLLAPAIWRMDSQADTNDIPFFQHSFPTQAAGASPRPTKSCAVSFVPSCFGRAFPADERQSRSPTGVKGRNAPCAGRGGAEPPQCLSGAKPPDVSFACVQGRRAPAVPRHIERKAKRKTNEERITFDVPLQGFRQRSGLLSVCRDALPASLTGCPKRRKRYAGNDCQTRHSP